MHCRRTSYTTKEWRALSLMPRCGRGMGLVNGLQMMVSYQKSFVKDSPHCYKWPTIFLCSKIAYFFLSSSVDTKVNGPILGSSFSTILHVCYFYWVFRDLKNLCCWHSFLAEILAKDDVLILEILSCFKVLKIFSFIIFWDI